MNNPSLHSLLLLSDSALPLGSFAFSSGLESYLAHHKTSPSHHTPTASALSSFTLFLDLSIRNLSSTSLPYMLHAFRRPESLEELDNDVDASTPCTVARRASVVQGKALIGVWERSFWPCIPPPSELTPEINQAITHLNTFIQAQKVSKPDEHNLQLNAHFAPLFGVVCKALELDEDDAAYLFLLNHAKAVLSAAVRASVLGPYQSQKILAGRALRETIKGCVLQERERRVEDAGLTVPPMDLWMGRHELLYSRIFNS